ncbi:hypothetical protein ATANTOWER_008492 [Ataeniobius toweri]|uniref:Uncharacterized protein n=1 Tax=Ataeniobius toweri TaxID=208326 RepID=A0ABU7C721_9TELE|nr:hypothetical protein [Ataeniobius toweri]
MLPSWTYWDIYEPLVENSCSEVRRRSPSSRGAQSRAAAPPHSKESAEEVHLIKIPPGSLLLEVFQGMFHNLRQTQNSGEGLYVPPDPGTRSYYLTFIQH